MSDSNAQSLWGDDKKPEQVFEINLKRLRMRDYADFEKHDGKMPMEVQVRILARVTGRDEDDIWDLDIESYAQLNVQLDKAMSNLVKKVNAGNSSST